MRRICLSLFIFAALTAIVYSGCRRDVPVVDVQGTKYPAPVANIILTKCAVSGCHNAQSKDAAAGLDLSTWSTMMQGDRNGAVCIPYSAEYSTLFLFTNTFSDLGATVQPTMPLNADPLTREQVITLRNWINAGAPNADGVIKWSDNPTRKKYYVTNQGCDVVCAIDAETNLQMRYIPVGADVNIESPHAIRLSPDGQYWYCCFILGRYLEKHRTSDDALVGRILLGPTDSSAVGSWNTFAITPDGRYAFVIDWSFNGRIAWVDLQTMQWRQTYQGSGLLVQPHGSYISPDGNTLYVTTTIGNFIYKIDVSTPQFPSFDQIPIDGSSTPISVSSENPHEIVFSPDGTKYFCTASGTNVVRVLSTSTDQLIATIPVGIYPQELSLSSDPAHPYLYVTCMEDTATYPGNRGSVSIINWQTNSFVGSVNSGFQPHGVAVNEDKGVCFVANRNAFPGGPAPHHSTSCAGRNGYFSLIDMNTNQLIPGSKTELVVDPYGAVYKR